jgi:hypothetical protein
MVIDFDRYRQTRSLGLSIPFGERVAIARKDQGITEDEWDIYQMVDRRMMRLRQKITTLHLCAVSQKNTTSAKVV